MNATVENIAVSRVVRGSNDRYVFDDDKLMDLAWSIKVNGLAQPITVRPVDDGMYEIVAGERRFRAMTECLGYDEVPALVQELEDEKASAIMLVENTSRQDLNPMEEAKAYQGRIDRYEWSLERIADTAGVSKRTVESRLSLLQLREEIQHLVEHDNIPIGHAEAMTCLNHDRQLSALRVFQSSKKALPLAEFRDVVATMRDEQNQDSFINLEEFFIQKAAQISVDGGKRQEANLDLPTRNDLPVMTRNDASSARDFIELYIRRLQAEGFGDEAAVIGTMYSQMLSSKLIKRKVRITD